MWCVDHRRLPHTRVYVSRIAPPVTSLLGGLVCRRRLAPPSFGVTVRSEGCAPRTVEEVDRVLVEKAHLTGGIPPVVHA